MGYLDPDVICGDAKMCVPTATLLHFGILTSSMHNASVRAVCGRLKSDFRSSAAIVYNNFPWRFWQQDSAPNQPPESVDQARAAIEFAAQGVLGARAQFPGSSLADLYDPLTMPPALLKAHQRLDAERVACLFTQYQRITSLLPAEGPAGRRSARLRKPKAAA